MKKNILLLLLVLLCNTTMFGQKYQRIAYIDMEYILESIPEYDEIKNTISSKVDKWKKELDREARKIEVLKTDLANEKAILTKDIIAEREEDIAVMQESLRKLEDKYFGSEGDLYNLRKQLVKPVQDQVYNVIQAIATRKKYDFVFDKSSELIMLYSNKKHDISDLVLKYIGIEQTKKSRKEKLEAQKQLLKERRTEEEQRKDAARRALLQKREAEKKARESKLEERKRKLIEQREKKRELLRKKKEALRKAKAEKQKAATNKSK